jgi:hypothetical protein
MSPAATSHTGKPWFNGRWTFRHRSMTSPARLSAPRRDGWISRQRQVAALCTQRRNTSSTSSSGRPTPDARGPPAATRHGYHLLTLELARLHLLGGIRPGTAELQEVRRAPERCRDLAAAAPPTSQLMLRRRGIPGSGRPEAWRPPPFFGARSSQASVARRVQGPRRF